MKSNNSPYEQQKLKTSFSHYKNRKNKISSGKKQFLGKFRIWGKVKTHKPNFKKIKDSLEKNILFFNICKLDTM